MNFKKSKSLLVLSAMFLLGFSAVAQTAGSARPAKSYSRSYGRTGLLFDTSIYFGQTEATANPVVLNQWQSTTSIYDLKLGYILENSFYFGAEYSTRNDNQISTTSAFGNSTGLGVGYFSDSGFNLRVFYVLNEIYGDYTSGTGYRAELGYLMNMTSTFFLGFMVSIRQTTFKSNNTIIAFDSWTRKETYPFLTLGFLIN